MYNFSKPLTLHLCLNRAILHHIQKSLVAWITDRKFSVQMINRCFFFNRLFLLHSGFQVYLSRVSQKRAKLVSIYTEHSREAWSKPKPLKWVQTARQSKCSLCDVYFSHDPSASALPGSSQWDNTLHSTPMLHTILPSATRHTFIKKLVEFTRCNRQWKC